MKKLLLIFLAIITLASCEKEVEKPKKAPNGCLFSGKIEGFRKRSISLKGFNFSQKIKFDKKTKTFKDSLINITPGHYTLFIGKRQVSLYLTKLDDLKLTVDAKKRAVAPIFEGKTAEINNYLIKRLKKGKSIKKSAGKFFSQDEDDFLATNDKYKEALLKLATSSQLPAEYLEKEKRNIEYEWVRAITNYQKFHRVVISDDEYVTSEEFPIEIDVVDKNNATDYVNSSEYRKLLREYIKTIAESNTTEDGDFYVTHLETVNAEIKDTLVKNNMVHKISKEGLTYTNNLGDFYKKYMSYSTSEKYKREIKNTYDKLKLTAAGQPSPKFNGYKNYADGKKMNLDDLLNKGNYLYIDIWATWCAFCKKEIPLLKNFEVKYHGKNIQFVSISVEEKKNYEKWKKIVEENEMGGIQLFAGNTKDKLKFTRDYVIKGFPRFILLDPQGNVISANAPRPSDGEKLNEIFEELGLEKKK